MKSWHLIGLGTSLGKFLLKERLNEGLQFIVNLSALKLHLGATGRGRGIPSRGLPMQ